jgi:hypothetical protein
VNWLSTISRKLLLTPFFYLLVALSFGPTMAEAASLTLNWADNSNNENGFKIERKTGTTGTFAQIATVGSSITSYTDSSVAAGTTYCYRVRAYNSTANSAYSNEVCGTTPTVQTFTLTVSKAGTGSGTVTSSPAGINCGAACAANYTSNQIVTLTATPAIGSSFAGWSGNADCADGSVTLNASKSCTATFNAQQQQYTLSVSKTGTGSGTITSTSPAGINCGATCAANYTSGQVVTLTATPASSSTFAGWSGNADCTDGSVTMNSTMTCIATFNLSAVTPVPNTTFVSQQYLDFLDREADAGGFAAWVNALDGGLPRASLIEAFMDSEEFFSEGKFIAQTYLGILTRDAEYSGFRDWLAALLAGLSHEQIVQTFLESGEFKARFGSSLTNGQFVERMYLNILLRSSDPNGLNYWVGQLNSGQMTRAQLALSFLDSDEFQNLSGSQNRVDVSLLYLDMLRRAPDSAGLSAWLEAMNAGMPLTSVIDGFLNSGEYKARF